MKSLERACPLHSPKMARTAASKNQGRGPRLEGAEAIKKGIIQNKLLPVVEPVAVGEGGVNSVSVRSITKFQEGGEDPTGGENALDHDCRALGTLCPIHSKIREPKPSKEPTNVLLREGGGASKTI